MRAAIIPACLALFVVAGTTMPSAMPGNLSPGNGKGRLVHDSHGSGQFECRACHTEFGKAQPALQPLWDSGQDATRFSLFGSVSEVCLSCHDTAIAPAPPLSIDWCFYSRKLPRAAAQTPRHHPHGVPYGSSSTADFLPPDVGENRRVKLFTRSDGPDDSPYVECASCHDPHDPANRKFLRVSSERQELCRCCHARLPEMTCRVYLPMQVGRPDPGECQVCHRK